MEAGWSILNKRKVVFLDRDGVINYSALPHQYIISWEEFRVFPWVSEAIQQCNKAGYYVVVISNQRGIARGLCTREQIDVLHQQMIEMFRQQGANIDKVYICPHENEECDCRKPKPGLFYIAEAQLWKEKKQRVDKESSWMIGDSKSDIDAGKQYGVKTVWINNSNSELKVEADYIVKNLFDAVNYILKKGK